ncbi:hypothetical protein B0H14DRAFT_3439968 [Mycena olivaceomarginata]|nr:hypothetical protein B0H14DRAFT_3439968 [Mycena olivaceomarginata]
MLRRPPWSFLRSRFALFMTTTNCGFLLPNLENGGDEVQTSNSGSSASRKKKFSWGDRVHMRAGEDDLEMDDNAAAGPKKNRL